MVLLVCNRVYIGVLNNLRVDEGYEEIFEDYLM